jgi:tRNA 2-thiouridine synthesizing protein E
MMKQHETPVVQPEVDEEGFLVDGKLWTEEVAEILAKEEVPQGLDQDHWVIVSFLREYYNDAGTVPPVRMISRRTGMSLRRIKELFPHGLTKGACRIAGIPRIVIRPSYLYP